MSSMSLRIDMQRRSESNKQRDRREGRFHRDIIVSIRVVKSMCRTKQQKASSLVYNIEKNE